MAETAVVGGGVLGMAVAQRLRQRGDDVTVFESSSHLGGAEPQWHVDGISWDRHCHVISTTDTRTKQLLSALALDGELRQAPARSALHGTGQTSWPFATPADLLRLPALRPSERAKVAGTVLAAYLQSDTPSLDQLPAQRWLTEHAGTRAFDLLWRPLLRARLGDDWPIASARYVITELQRRIVARPRRGSARLVNHLAGGRGRLIAAFANVLTDAGVKLELDRPVHEIQPARAGLELVFEDASATFDKAVVTTSARTAVRLCPALRASERQCLLAVRYVGVLSASVLISRSLSNAFVTYVTDPAAPFTQVVEMTNVIPPAELEGWHLLYLTRHVSSDDDWLQIDDATVEHRFLDHLRTMYPGLEGATTVRAVRVSRIRQLFPLPVIGAARSAPDVVTSIPGLQLLGSANLRFASANLNDTLALVQELR